MSKKLLFFVAVLVVISAAVGYTYINQTEAEAETETNPELVEEFAADTKFVSAEGFVQPKKKVNLAFETSGWLINLDIIEGDMVEEGQVLARLEDIDQQFAIAEVEAQLLMAQANLNQVLAGPTPEEIAQKDVALARAEAALETLLAGSTDEDIAQVRASLNLRQFELQELLAGNRAEDILASEAAVNQAAADVQQAQLEYNKVEGSTRDEAFQNVGITLQKATTVYESAKAQHEDTVAGATLEDITVSRSLVAGEQALLTQIMAGPTDEEITSLLADVQQRQADLDLLLAGSTDEAIAVSEAEVAQVEAQLEQVKLTVEDTEIMAPFDGVIADLPVEDGQYINMGETILTLAQRHPWYIETDDLTELDVIHIEEGQTVSIKVDALPGEIFEGTITHIKPQSETKAGDVTYTIDIALADNTASDERLRWGMTVFVDVIVDETE
ncbi:efflux RND transporter periplasmic adaptor subunit [Anaerolineales bacterium HSG24]|nr:efflux RND transporter periplasmic adaptor subunit [Anaerolineales bacterium HSG24]